MTREANVVVLFLLVLALGTGCSTTSEGQEVRLRRAAALEALVTKYVELKAQQPGNEEIAELLELYEAELAALRAAIAAAREASS